MLWIKVEKIYEARYIYLLLCIPFALLGLFVYYPFTQAVIRSFYEWNGHNVSEFIGLQNFVELFWEDPLFYKSIYNALILTAAIVVKAVTVPMAAAWMIHHLRRESARYVSRILVILPSVVPAIVAWLLWRTFLASDGLVNRFLELVGLPFLQHAWLGDTTMVLIGIILVGFPWVNGANTLIYLAGFLQIPQNLYDAARIDGATTWRTFLYLELPMLKAQTRLLVTLALIAGLNNYESIFVLTQGGPANASIVPGIFLYNNAFIFGRMGYASAIGVILFILILGLTILNLKYMQPATGRDAA